MEYLATKDVRRPTLISKGALRAQALRFGSGQRDRTCIEHRLGRRLRLYVKTKNFHWHVNGPHFRDYHLLLDEQAAELLAITDRLAERVRKICATTVHSVGHIARLQTIDDNDALRVESSTMLDELR